MPVDHGNINKKTAQGLKELRAREDLLTKSIESGLWFESAKVSESNHAN